MDHEHRNDINDVANSIDEFVTDKTEDLLRICHDLTACNSINPPGSTVETAQVIQDFFKKKLKNKSPSLQVITFHLTLLCLTSGGCRGRQPPVLSLLPTI